LAPVAAAGRTPEYRVSAQIHRVTRADPALGAFYASRNYQSLWSIEGRIRPEVETVLSFLRTADLDGLDPSNYLRGGVEQAVADAASGDPGALARAELLLSHDFAAYVRDVRRVRNVGVIYADAGLRPPPPSSEASSRDWRRPPT